MFSTRVPTMSNGGAVEFLHLLRSYDIFRDFDETSDRSVYFFLHSTSLDLVGVDQENVVSKL